MCNYVQLGEQPREVCEHCVQTHYALRRLRKTKVPHNTLCARHRMCNKLSHLFSCHLIIKEKNTFVWFVLYWRLRAFIRICAIIISCSAFVPFRLLIIGQSKMCALAEPIWRRALSAGLVCWVSWRSCGDGSAWKTRTWPSRCPLEETSPPCCNSRTTARWVLSPQATLSPHFTRFRTKFNFQWIILQANSFFKYHHSRVSRSRRLYKMRQVFLIKM